MPVNTLFAMTSDLETRSRRSHNRPAPASRLGCRRIRDTSKLDSTGLRIWGSGVRISSGAPNNILISRWITNFANSAFPAFTVYIATVSPRLATGVQVTLWHLSREKSLIAKRCEMKGNSATLQRPILEAHL